MQEVTDPSLLSQLEGGQQEVTDPALLAQLNGTPAPAEPATGLDLLAGLGSAAARPVLNAVTALPLLAMDAGVQSRNLIGNAYNKIAGNPATPDYELPSSMYRQALDHYTQAPTTAVGKGAEFLSTMLAGSALPAPTAEGPPANFQNPAQSEKAIAFAKGREQGLVAPPSSVNPSLKNSLLEGIGGKLKLQQEAMGINQPITNSLVAKGLGQNPDAPLTLDSLSSIRAGAAQSGYAPIRGLGEITADTEFSHALEQIGTNFSGAAKIDPRLGSPQISEIADALNKPKFDSGDLVDAISALRAKANDAYSSGNGSTGSAYKQMAGALEDLVERHLTNQGQNGSDLLSGYRSARQLMAQTYTVGKALNDVTGDVNATYLGRLAKGGKPLSGELATVGDFAASFPKAMRVPTESYPAISPLDAYGAAIGSAASGSAAPLAVPLSRVAIRSYLLSARGQAGAMPSATVGISPQALNAFFGIGLPTLAQPDR